MPSIRKFLLWGLLSANRFDGVRHEAILILSSTINTRSSERNYSLTAYRRQIHRNTLAQNPTKITIHQYVLNTVHSVHIKALKPQLIHRISICFNLKHLPQLHSLCFLSLWSFQLLANVCEQFYLLAMCSVFDVRFAIFVYRASSSGNFASDCIGWLVL